MLAPEAAVWVKVLLDQDSSRMVEVLPSTTIKVLKAKLGLNELDQLKVIDRILLEDETVEACGIGPVQGVTVVPFVDARLKGERSWTLVDKALS